MSSEEYLVRYYDRSKGALVVNGFVLDPSHRDSPEPSQFWKIWRGDHYATVDVPETLEMQQVRETVATMARQGRMHFARWLAYRDRLE